MSQGKAKSKGGKKIKKLSKTELCREIKDKGAALRGREGKKNAKATVK
jgi:hypothetical protein